VKIRFFAVEIRGFSIFEFLSFFLFIGENQRDRRLNFSFSSVIVS